MNKPFIDKKQVTLFKDRKPNNQKGHYNKYILPVKNISEWFLVCDLDEFVYSRNEFNKISDYLKIEAEEKRSEKELITLLQDGQKVETVKRVSKLTGA